MNKPIFLFVLMSLFSSPVLADEGFLYLKGSKQGEIRGDSMSKGRENLNIVVAFEYSTGTTPIAPNGMASGKRTRPPVSFTLKWSKATPLLINAAIMNEVLTNVRYDNYSANRLNVAGTGLTSLSETIEFTNARILGVKIHDENGNDPNIEPLVTITLTYQTAIITHKDGSISAQDDNSGNQ